MSIINSTGISNPLSIKGNNNDFPCATSDLSGSETVALLGLDAPYTSIASMASATGKGYSFLRVSGREGLFVWSATNLTAFVSADPQQGVYVAPAGAPSGSAGAWVRIHNGLLYPDWFSNGIIADDVAINAAISLANVLGGADVELIRNYNTTATIVHKQGVRVIARGRGGRTGTTQPKIIPSSAVTVAYQVYNIDGYAIDGLCVDMTNMTAANAIGAELHAAWGGTITKIQIVNATGGAGSKGVYIHTDVGDPQGTYWNNIGTILVTPKTGAASDYGIVVQGQVTGTERMNWNWCTQLSAIGPGGAGTGFKVANILFDNLANSITVGAIDAEWGIGDGVQVTNPSSGTFLRILSGEITNNAGWGIYTGLTDGTCSVIAEAVTFGGNNGGGTGGQADGGARVTNSLWGPRFDSGFDPLQTFVQSGFFSDRRTTTNCNNGDTIPLTAGFQTITTSGGVVTLGNPQVAAPVGSLANNSPIIVLRGNSNSNYVSLTNGTGLALRETRNLQSNCVLVLKWLGSGLWVEVAFTTVTGTSGHVVPYLDQSNTWSATQTILGGSFLVSRVGGAATASAILDGDTSQVKQLVFRTAGVQHWILDQDNATESGANAGANFALNAYDDSGSFIGNVWTATRSNRVVSFGAPLKTQSTVVGSLISAATAGSGARSFVTDATATTFMSVVVGGGANKVPVVSDGTNWLIG